MSINSIDDSEMESNECLSRFCFDAMFLGSVRQVDSPGVRRFLDRADACSWCKRLATDIDVCYVERAIAHED